MRRVAGVSIAWLHSAMHSQLTNSIFAVRCTAMPRISAPRIAPLGSALLREITGIVVRALALSVAQRHRLRAARERGMRPAS